MFHLSIDVLDIILKDVKDFDPQIWVYAVGISVSALVILGLTMCILLLRDHYLEMEEKRMRGNNCFFSNILSLDLSITSSFFFRFLL